MVLVFVLERTVRFQLRDIVSSGERLRPHCTLSGTRHANVGLIVACRPASPLLQDLPQTEVHFPQTQILGIVALPASLHTEIVKSRFLRDSLTTSRAGIFTGLSMIRSARYSGYYHPGLDVCLSNNQFYLLPTHRGECTEIGFVEHPSSMHIWYGRYLAYLESLSAKFVVLSRASLPLFSTLLLHSKDVQ